VNSSGGLYNLDAALTFNTNGVNSQSANQIYVDGAPVGQAMYFQSAITAYNSLSIPVQLSLSAGQHTVALVTQGPVGTTIWDSSLQATGYQTIDGQAAATGVFSSSIDNFNLTSTGPTTVRSITVNSSGGLYDLDAALTFNTNGINSQSANQIYVDGSPVGEAMYFQSASTAYNSLRIPVQLSLSAGQHTVALVTQGPVGTTIWDSSLRATGYQTVPEPSVAALLICFAPALLRRRPFCSRSQS
jgi:hypothetical protein